MSEILKLHWASIAQAISGAFAAAFTGLSWRWVRKTGAYIKSQSESLKAQTEAIVQQVQINNDLFKIEQDRDSQLNKISSYLSAEPIKVEGHIGSLRSFYGYGIKAVAHVDNHSNQPIHDIVVRLQQIQSVYLSIIMLKIQDIPSSNVAPLFLKEIDISPYLRDIESKKLVSKMEFSNLQDAKMYARRIELEYISILNFRDFEGNYWEKKPTERTPRKLEISFALSIYANALTNFFEKSKEE